MNRIDHLVWAASDLDAAVAQLETLTGVRATPGGSHPGRGTRNALLSLGPGCYLEILAPDPAQTTAPMLLPEEPFERPFLLTFAVSCANIEATADAIAATGYSRPKVEAMSRRTQEGGELTWRLARVSEHAFGPVIPFLIDWGSTPHPSASAPGADSCSLVLLRAAHHDSSGVSALLQSIGTDVQCRHGHTALTATLRTPNGQVVLTSDR